MRHAVRHTLFGGLLVTATLLLAAGPALAAAGTYDGQGQNRDSRAAIEAAEADALGKADTAGSDRSTCSRTFLQVYPPSGGPSSPYTARVTMSCSR